MFWKTNKRLKTTERLMKELVLYEKARTLLRDDIFTFQTFKPVIWIEMLNKDSALFGHDEERELRLPQKILADLGYNLQEQLSPTDYLYVHPLYSKKVNE